MHRSSHCFRYAVHASKGANAITFNSYLDSITQASSSKFSTIRSPAYIKFKQAKQHWLNLRIFYSRTPKSMQGRFLSVFHAPVIISATSSIQYDDHHAPTLPNHPEYEHISFMPPQPLLAADPLFPQEHPASPHPASLLEPSGQPLRPSCAPLRPFWQPPRPHA